MSQRIRITTPPPSNALIDKTVGQDQDRVERVEEIVKEVLQRKTSVKRPSDKLKVGQAAALRRYLKAKKTRHLKKASKLLND